MHETLLQVNTNTLCLGCMRLKEEPVPVCPVCGWDADDRRESPLYLPPGTVLIDRYLLGRVLGHGGFGITYLGLDLNLNIRLAVKEYLPSGMATRVTNGISVSIYRDEAAEHFEKGLARFEEEAQAVAQFEGHPGIVSVRDFFHSHGTAYMVMHYIEGTTLKKRIRKTDDRLPYAAARQVMTQVMTTLGDIHQTGLLHRDISPGNIYITNEGRVKLLDFGAARYAVGQYTRSLSVILKEGYAPPEQYLTRGRQGPWTDIYATAATFYHILTGYPPPQALDRSDQDTLVPPRQRVTDVPKKADAALMKALSLRAEDRFQTMQAFQEALGEEAKVFVAPSPIHKPRRRGKVLVALLTLALAVSVVGWLMTDQRATELEAQLRVAEQQKIIVEPQETPSATTPSDDETTQTQPSQPLTQTPQSTSGEGGGTPVRQTPPEPMSPTPGALLSESGVLSTDDAPFLNRYLSIHGYQEVHTLSVAEPADLVFDLRSSQFDTYMIVKTPNGDEHTSDDVRLGNTNSRMEMKAAQAGTWTIIVTSSVEKQTGRYALEVVPARQ